jgi:hypothetical protein
MSKFNTTSIGSNKTTNKCGFTAYKMNPKEELVNIVLTSFFRRSKILW